MRRAAAGALAGALVTLPVVADAACSWVLWGSVKFPGSAPSEPTPILARDTREECEQRRSDYYASADERRGKGGAGQESFTCLPDTIDPRGPKGGSR